MLLFIYAAGAKLWDVQQFRVQLGQSPMISEMAPSIAIGIPLAELAVVVLLAIPSTAQIGYYIFLGMMTMFTTYIAFMLAFASYVPCACGGVLERLGWVAHLYFNGFYMLLAIAAILLYQKPEKS